MVVELRNVSTRCRLGKDTMEFDALEVELSVALARRSFRTVKNGYDREEVDAYLSYALTTARQLLSAAADVGKEANTLRTSVAELRGVVNTQQATIDAAESELARLRLEVERRREEAREAAARAWALQADLDAARAEIASLREAAGRDAFSEVGEEVASVLRAAHEAAAAIRAEAERSAEEARQAALAAVRRDREEAERALADARQEANRLVAEARREADELRAEAERSAEEARQAALAAVRRDREEAERALADARQEADRLVAEARREADELVGAALARTEQLADVERQLREGLTTAARWVLDAVNGGALGGPPPLPAADAARAAHNGSDAAAN